MDPESIGMGYKWEGYTVTISVASAHLSSSAEIMKKKYDIRNPEFKTCSQRRWALGDVEQGKNETWATK